MRKASMIIGIIGGVLAILVGLITLFGGMALTKGLSGAMQGAAETVVSSDEYADLDMSIEGLDDFEASLDEAEGAITNMVALYAAATIIAGLAGLVGAIIVRQYNRVAGAAMILTAIILASTAHFLSFILLLVGGVLAFFKDKKAADDMEYDELSFS